PLTAAPPAVGEPGGSSPRATAESERTAPAIGEPGGSSPRADIAPIRGDEPPGSPAPRTDLRGLTRAAAPWAVGAWLAGAVLLSVWRLGGWLHVRRLCERGTKPAAAVRAALDRLPERLRVRRAGGLRESARIDL